jgi:hypothetical protein
MRPIMTLMVLAANTWALAAVLGSPIRPAARFGWLTAIVLLPPAGALAWLVHGSPRARRAVRV